MALSPHLHPPEHLRGLVDMGSNGIRFSISSLAPSTARIMPTLYQSRAGISLYDAQYSTSGERQPISEPVIAAVVTSFQHFGRTCQDFGVPQKNVEVLATEATRTAVNSEEFRARIMEATGWEVRMLAKEEEGKVGALGIGSSLPGVQGLVMDLGGGSTQLSYLIKEEDSGNLKMPPGGAVSLPYGAAAMSRRLEEAEKSGNLRQLEEEIRTRIGEAFTALQVPRELQQAADREGGFTLYLSGGGFRGWGYILLSQHRVQPYPIPAINGFRVSRQDFLSTDAVKLAAAASLDGTDESTNDIFRISDRRAAQVPAVAFLVKILAQALPQVKEVRFCQGGVREGHLFSSLPFSVAAQDPLVVATQPYANLASSKRLAELLASAFPSDSSVGAHDDYKSTFRPAIMTAFANLMFYHSTHSKDLQATAALRCTTSGVLAGVHGLLHESRALLALLLCARYGGEIPRSDEVFKQNLESLVESPWTLWWINLLGAIAALVAEIYPAGYVEDRSSKERLTFKSKWERTGKGNAKLELKIHFGPGMGGEALDKEVKAIEKVGKKKRWIGGKDGCGYKVDVVVKHRSKD